MQVHGMRLVCLPSLRVQALNSVGGALSSRKSYQGVPSSERIDSSEEEE